LFTAHLQEVVQEKRVQDQAETSGKQQEEQQRGRNSTVTADCNSSTDTIIVEQNETGKTLQVDFLSMLFLSLMLNKAENFLWQKLRKNRGSLILSKPCN